MISLNINKLQAGRELDYLIQEQVFKKCAHRNERYYACQGDSGFECADCGADLYGNRCPKYSTDIAAAWEVINHIHSHWLFGKRQIFLQKLQMESSKMAIPSEKDVWISWPDVLFYVTPEAICLAALQAVGGG